MSKLSSSRRDEKLKNAAFKEAFEHDAYLKRWRKLLDVTFNKNDTLELAKAIQSAKPNLSLYQAKLLVSQCHSYDYECFSDVFIKLFDEKMAAEIDQLLKYLFYMGKANYEKTHTPEYEKALDDWFDSSFEEAVETDEWITLGEGNRDPILDSSEEERQIMKKEFAEEKEELGNKIANWIKENPKVQRALPTMFRIWCKNYAHWSWNADGRKVCMQLNAVRQDVLTQNWTDLAKQFENLPGWWD